eukprot:gb/GECG01000044.1/.p1 GENE.gb/GECG01000044.1/~~gb/GECG01000044.1/.p1  ORF type:complete len:657 (+),score=71.44 gb/GECG01000044.1/:1-1971(+)
MFSRNLAIGRRFCTGGFTKQHGTATMSTLNQLTFNDVFTKEFPADPETENKRRQVIGAAYSLVSPTPVEKPTLLAWSGDLASKLGLPANVEEVNDTVVEWLTGNTIPDGVNTWAHVYGGFQFGNWAGQLGDGRAINVGTLSTDASDSNKRGDSVAELQLKGAGETPYSRFADGRAVLRSSIREFIASEAMAALGIPTTRALSITFTGEGVERDQFYNGNVQMEPGAIVCRVAPSFLRFGSIEWAAAKDQTTLMEQYIDFTIDNFYPHLNSLGREERIKEWYGEVVERSARLVALWQATGFVHGVLNTDNMSLIGLTIDYGPYGWMEGFDPSFTPNTSDGGKRYCYKMQPSIFKWNCMRLGICLAKLLGEEYVEGIQSQLDRFERTFYDSYYELFRRKLGFASWNVKEKSLVQQTEVLLGNHTEVVDCGDDLDAAIEQYGDDALLGKLFQLMRASRADFTNVFRALTVGYDVIDTQSLMDRLNASVLNSCGAEISDGLEAEWRAWCEAYCARVKRETVDDRLTAQSQTNPKYVPRNYQMYAATKALEGEGKAEKFQAILSATCNPFDCLKDQGNLSSIIVTGAPLLCTGALSKAPHIKKTDYSNDLGVAVPGISTSETFVQEWNPYNTDGSLSDEQLQSPATKYESASRVTQLSCSS